MPRLFRAGGKSRANPGSIDATGSVVDSAVTFEMVAERAGVSRSTVAQVLDASGDVPADLVDRVISAAADLGYAPQHGSSGSGRRSHSIALLIPETTGKFFADPYFASIIQGAAAFLDDTDYVLNLLVGSPTESDKILRHLHSEHVDGVLVISHRSDDSSYLKLGESVPVVFAGRPTGIESDDAYYVDIDNVGAAAAATRHLIERGHTRVATIAGPQNMVTSADRVAGWEAALAAAGLEPGPIESADFSPVGGVYAMRRLLKHEQPFDGIFIASSQMASGALTVLRDAGLSVPGDVGITTVDNDQFAINAEPPLTTMEQPTGLHGAKIAEMLLDIIEGRPVDKHAMIATTLVVRDSA
ncbi:LacI family DNA-binding transcriptional regulator [Parafrigoribacterium humi]|jgi:LacI family transcriptional regulator|uniref:LacI family DNA-binding transcriptional regulator n=1 Tax=Parafrigoribacterium humi TaxID=3144664 RepID=UPI0032EFE316